MPYLVAPMALTLFVIGVLAKYAGVTEKLGKNFGYIMGGAVFYLSAAVFQDLGNVVISPWADITVVTNPIAAILAVIGFACVVVGTILGAINLLRK